ncbi:QacE family quaternary ammonium compound efflux SMR transporter [Nocardioidaceae bacterium]|nr:QacE family quaternary ammonium compound efflux SMR transporter [Nocardioidaceae bacterium]
MRTWLLLVGAILSEVTATLSLKAAVDRPALYALSALGFTSAFAFLTLVLRRGTGLGVAYGVWAASGVALTAVLSAVLLDERLSALTGAGIAVIIVGVLAVEIGSQQAHTRTAAAVAADTWGEPG